MNTLYTTVLTFHNVIRWLVILFAIIAIVRGFSGWLGKKEWSKVDDRAGMLFTSFFDLQLLLGLILYIFFSPFPRSLFANFAAGMRDAATRFFGMEHLLIMVIALIIGHIGRGVSRKAQQALIRHRRAAIWYTVSALLMVAAIPWPFFTSYSRPLFRLFGITI